MLSACGFHLRGPVVLPKEFQKIYFTSPMLYSSFNKRLHQVLVSTDITIVESHDLAPYTLIIESAYTTQAETGVSSNAELRQFVISSQVQFQLLDQKGNVCIPKTTIKTTRNISISTNELLGAYDQRATFQDEMQEELINKLLRRLQAYAVEQHSIINYLENTRAQAHKS